MVRENDQIMFLVLAIQHWSSVSISGGVGTTSHPAASPLPVQRLQLEEFNGGSPMSQRSGFMRRESHVLADISEVDTLDSTTMTDQAVHNISAMFPTVEESHIRDLLKK